MNGIKKEERLELMNVIHGSVRFQSLRVWSCSCIMHVIEQNILAFQNVMGLRKVFDPIIQTRIIKKYSTN